MKEAKILNAEVIRKEEKWFNPRIRTTSGTCGTLTASNICYTTTSSNPTTYRITY